MNRFGRLTFRTRRSQEEAMVDSPSEQGGLRRRPWSTHLQNKADSGRGHGRLIFRAKQNSGRDQDRLTVRTRWTEEKVVVDSLLEHDGPSMRSIDSPSKQDGSTKSSWSAHLQNKVDPGRDLDRSHAWHPQLLSGLPLRCTDCRTTSL